MLIPSFSEQTMSFTTSNLVAVSNGNNNNNIIAASNGDSYIAAISGLIGNQGPFTGAKFFKGATPGTIKKPSAGVAGMKTTVGFDSFTGVDAQVSKPSSSLRNKLFLASKPKRYTHPHIWVQRGPPTGWKAGFRRTGLQICRSLLCPWQ